MSYLTSLAITLEDNIHSLNVTSPLKLNSFRLSAVTRFSTEL